MASSAAGANLVNNPSTEIANTTNTAPTSWNQGKWGTNTTTFTYKTSDAHTGTKSLYVNTTKYTSGDAKWYFTNVPVSPNTQYTYSEFYKSSVATEVDIAYTSTTNQISYVWLGTPAASATNWAQTNYTFTTPANVKSLTIFHVINKVGWLQTDDFSLTSTTAASPPTVNLTAPASGSTVTGVVDLAATASDTNGIAGVQFRVDNTNVGAEDSTAPYSVSLDTKTLTNGSHTISAVARNTGNLTATSSWSVNVQNVAPSPSVAISTPANGSTVSGTQAISATATNAVGVQFKVDNVNVGSEDVTAPFSVSWDTKTVTNGAHSITATARNAANATITANAVVTVNNPTAPSVSFTAPANNATVSGNSVNITANASDDVGVLGVQFKIDGNNMGAEDTVAPYAATLDSTTLTNGNHIVTATARNPAGLTTTTSLTLNVQNAVAPPASGPNLITNPSFETANGTAPANWLMSSWGTNTSNFSYPSTGHTGGRSARVDITSYTNGAANWYYANIPVTVGKTYKYENWYQSNVETQVDAAVTMADGSIQYFWLGNVPSSTNWAKYSSTFTVPLGAKSMAIYQILTKVGYLTTDDYTLNEYTPSSLNRGLVSVTFDDSWANQYTNGLPLLQKYGLAATFYVLSGELTSQPEYMNASQVLSLHAGGHEIGSHTITHTDLTTVSQSQLVQEMSQSQITLQNIIGAPVKNFAYPYGAYNANTLNVGKQYYRSQRSVNRGVNSKDNFDITALKIQEVNSSVSQAQVKSWIDEAIAQKAWLILCYHEIANTPVAPEDAYYTVKPADLDAHLGYLKQTGVTVKTVNQALDEVLAQL